MNTSANREINAGSRGQTIADLFTSEVSDTNADARQQMLHAIRTTSRATEAGKGVELPALFINNDGGEIIAAPPAAKMPEFDVIRF